MAEKSLDVVSGFIAQEIAAANDESKKFIESDAIKNVTDALVKKATMSVVGHFLSEEELAAIDEKAGRFTESGCNNATTKLVDFAKTNKITTQLCAKADKIGGKNVSFGDKDASVKQIIKTLIAGEATDGASACIRRSLFHPSIVSTLRLCVLLPHAPPIE